MAMMKINDERQFSLMLMNICFDTPLFYAAIIFAARYRWISRDYSINFDDAEADTAWHAT